MAAASSAHIGAGVLHHREKPMSPKGLDYLPKGPFVFHADPPADLNKNTSWLLYPGIWTSYVLIIGFVWMLFVSLGGVPSGLAWTYVHLLHFVITFYLLHWRKGSPFGEDQGIYDRLTMWEQIDDGVQFTRTKKFFTAVPVVLFLIASHATDYHDHPFFALNVLAVGILLLAKTPMLHKVRIFGINSDYPS
ncbi:ORMDL family protein [Klebsormidium nitens]|uniref:ORMDL family protein n=1 Tax=Klebsormidium nitens TaxID=105231 RepID=A0A1Y1HJ28_KLENI|nr:ORMDL family protein [Klebsormidium nitens]|eukprot:GAQ77913.1 ORMDL family protein [Klebsormidium nitens]